ncbi:MAG: glycosyltransferase family A protein [Cyclobacteriaceae bacterium]|nr:glycosyltransferase family A protein [Cyclobacteriaceae bacterium]
MHISCFIASADATDLQQTINQLRESSLVESITVVCDEKPAISEVLWIKGSSFTATETIKLIAAASHGKFTLLYTKSLPLTIGQFGLERMVRMAEDSSAGMLYTDYFESKSGQLQPNPVIEYQAGSLRDDFNFGSLMLYNTAALKSAANRMDAQYTFAALYDLRLKVSQNHSLVRLPEFLYTEVENDTRKSGQKMFDYVDPKNRRVQIEMEEACTQHLKDVGAYLEPKFKTIEFDETDFPVEASVIIPVRNRVTTITDAIKSVLSQQTNFDFNLIVIDNHSTDGTTEIVKSIAVGDKRLIHIIPGRKDLGIGGCWNEGVMDSRCGKFAVQLDSDDLYIDDSVLTKIVNAFYEQQCAMVVGSYQMVNFKLEEIPPGLIDHKEWTPENGRNNALAHQWSWCAKGFLYTCVTRGESSEYQLW